MLLRMPLRLLINAVVTHEHEPPGEGPLNDPLSVARTLALRRLDSAPRTRHELHSYLTSKGIPPEVCDVVLDRFTDVGLINDHTFADEWVRARFASRGGSRALLRRELQAKGIDPTIIENALAVITVDDEERRARELAETRIRRVSGQPADVARRRLASFLSRRGYSPSLAWAVARDVVSD